MNTQDDYICAGMEYALERAQIEGLRLHEPVSHGTDLRLWKISNIDLETKICEVVLETDGCPPQVLATKKFPFHELFNSRIALAYGKKVLHAQQRVQA